MMFSSKPSLTGDVPSAVEKFKRDLDRAVNEARHAHVDAGVIANRLDEIADALRVAFVTVSAVDAKF